ncbi:HNH endonuclease [Vibrio coralliilyticus]|uniref:HNH endonuclease n=1 Tax=Vibrio coralliilyticus TaxID=190893 RepID=UPI00148D0BE4|nr:HNH endonuclease [Vibrio coralliilyticus]NOH53257.1 HNH endonuclease [Vibrio coralliilyticus]
MRWVDYVVQAMENLGGEAAYSDLYTEIEKLKDGNLTKSWQATVRNTVESYSSDSDNWSDSRDDLFYSVNGKGSGRWALRNFETTDSVEARAIDYNTPDKQEYTVSRFIRDSKLSKLVKEKNNFRCQVCDFTFLLPNGKPYAEAHHLKPLGKEHSGPDIENNMICVCPNHHAMLDYCALHLDVEKVVNSSKHKVSRKFIEYSNQLFTKHSK